MSRYSNDLRLRAVNLLSKGKTLFEVGEILQIHFRTIRKWQLKNESGVLFKVLKSTGRPVVYDLDGLKKFVEDYPDKYIHEIKSEFFEAKGNKASFGGIHKALDRMDFRFKKKSSYLKRGIQTKDQTMNKSC
jgi:transposase